MQPFRWKSHDNKIVFVEDFEAKALRITEVMKAKICMLKILMPKR